MPRERIRGWYRYNHEPRYCDGDLIILAWCTITGKDRKDLPTQPMVLSAAKVCGGCIGQH